jgi:hypothetical protein
VRERGRAAYAAGQALDCCNPSLGFQRSKTRYRKRGQDTEDGDYDHKFDQRKTALFTAIRCLHESPPLPGAGAKEKGARDGRFFPKTPK